MSEPYSGYGGNVLNGAVDCDVQDWSADVEVGTWDSTTTADAGWDNVAAGTKKVSGTFNILYNPDKKPFGTLGLTPGTIISVLDLYINKTAAEVLTGSAMITKTSVKSVTKEGVKLAISFQSKGAWTLPS